MPGGGATPSGVTLEQLQGVWLRVERTVGEGPAEEPAEAVWAQAGRWFADVRCPRPGAAAGHDLDRAQAFSGTVAIEGGTVTWRHDIDTLRNLPGARADAADRARVTVRGDSLIEDGPGYEERWARVAGARSLAVVAELGGALGMSCPQARAVRVADTVVAVWAGQQPGGAVLGPAGEEGHIMVRGSVSEGRGRWAGLRLRSGLGRVPEGLAAALDPSVPAPAPWRRPQFGR